MAIQTQDFYANGLPTGIQANAGIVYTNLADGKQYKQKTIPFGSNWVSLGTTAYFYYQSSGSLPSQAGKAGKYLKTDGTNASWEDGATGVTSVTATSPVASTGGTTPVISMPKATESVNGYLSSTDWATFNSKSKITSGTATIDFGAGNNIATVRVTTALVTTASTIVVVVDGDGTTASHNAYEHRMVPLKLTAGNIINVTSFDIIATTDILLSGSFNLKYTIS